MDALRKIRAAVTTDRRRRAPAFADTVLTPTADTAAVSVIEAIGIRVRAAVLGTRGACGAGKNGDEQQDDRDQVSLHCAGT